jgi:hypothetical protein
MEYFLDNINKFFRWIFSLDPIEATVTDPEIKLLNSMRITAKCRFNAAVRLQRLGQYTFFTTTMFSLGLIFIPLYQKSGLQIPYSESVLTMLQIFLAVAVLVYSVVNGTAKYDMRSSILDTCGVKIKELIRKLRLEISQKKQGQDKVDLEKYHAEYHIISTEPENHHRVDYILATLETRQDFCITGFSRLIAYGKAIFLYTLPYLIPTSMMLFELLIISDILGVTTIFCNVFTDPSSIIACKKC